VQNAGKQISIPNIITIARILMTPFFVILLLKEQFGTALWVFIIAGVSDALDGLIARVFNQRTVLGAYLDPIADKLLLAAAFISLGILHMVPAWVVVIVITRDILILVGLAIISLTNTRLRISPSFVSKCTTGLQLVTIAMTLLRHEANYLNAALPVFFWLTACFTTLSGLHYIYVGMNILQTGTSSDGTQK
jgi:cardiolipin synthase